MHPAQNFISVSQEGCVPLWRSVIFQMPHQGRLSILVSTSFVLWLVLLQTAVPGGNNVEMQLRLSVFLPNASCIALFTELLRVAYCMHLLPRLSNQFLCVVLSHYSFTLTLERI